MSKLRLASSIILTRDSDNDIEIFLVQRAPQLRFMGGFWAFPGGTVIKEDNLEQEQTTEGQAFIQCAIRELFEETGILIGTLGEKVSNNEKERIRQQLLQDESLDEWLELLRTGEVSGRDIESVCNITTPPISPVRYKTRFLHVPLPTNSEPVIEIGELVKGQFFKPVDAIASWERGEMRIAPPNLFLLRLMAKHTLPEFKQVAEIETDRFEKGALHPVYFAPGFFLAPQTTPTLPPATTTNTLIIGNETLFVVEPATPEKEEQQQLFAKMDELINEGKRFEAILLTHYHKDHIGAVNTVSQRYKLPVRAHPLTYDRIPTGFIRGEPLNEGDRIELGTAPDGSPDWHLQIIHTPGHAPDHLCYLESRYQSAIVGDMLSTLSTILIDPPEGHMRTYLESLERLLTYPISTLFPSHGPVYSGDGGKLIRKFLAHRKDREDKIVNTLTTDPKTIDELLPHAYDDVAEETYPIASRSLLAGLIKLQEDGICEQDGENWRLIN